MSSYRCNFSLGNERYVQVCEWKGELRVDLREFRQDKPTKKGISLTLMRWKNFLDLLDYLDEALKEKKSYNCHLGGNVYCSVTENSVYVDIRQHWKPATEVVPTKKGLCLRPKEFSRLKELLPEINRTLPELDAVVPCHIQGDHINQLGMLRCSECNPDDFTNW